MKAILVIDGMPDCCFTCPLSCMIEEDDSVLVCKVEQTERRMKTHIRYTDKRPKWCPLKPLPHKLLADWYGEGYKEGFNACLEEIERSK